MNLLNIFKTDQKVTVKETYNFLIVAALQEELNEFYKLEKSFSKKTKKDGGAYEVEFECKGNMVKILTYTPNKMGMPINAIHIMDIISKHNPYYIIMIGTCACLNNKHMIGDILIPDRIFSYESGKYENGNFKPDYMAHSTGETLRKQAESLKFNLGKKIKYNVTTDEDFCSGAAVIDDSEIVRRIIDIGSRKLSGLDMEGYALACMNTLFKGDKEVIVIKGISDFANKKAESENRGNKELAKINSSKFALHLVKYLQNTVFAFPAKVKFKKG